jgi:uncharacterized protein
VVILRRGLEGALLRAIAAFPAVIVEGGRAVGKSTLCRSIIDRNGWPELIDVSDPRVAAALRIDPLRYLRDLREPTFIDEAQLLPELLIWVKRVVDERQGRPGQFVLTGSARIGREQLGGSDPLAGRAARLRMWSMTAAELAGEPAASARSLFDDATWDSFIAEPPVEEWDVRRGLRGGLPGIPGVLAQADANTWNLAMASYIESVIPLGAASARTDHGRLLRAFRYLVANPSQQLNLARMSDELQIRAETARNYLEALEAAFLIVRVEAHRPTEHKVLTAHPRVYATDLGLAAWAGRLVDASVSVSAASLGNLLENQFAHGLAATLEWGTERLSLRHWRDQRAKREVDLLLMHDDGRCVPIEVKSSTTVGPDATVGIEAFADANRDAFLRGVVAYCGRRTIDLSPAGLPPRSILAVPISRLLNSTI